MAAIVEASGDENEWHLLKTAEGEPYYYNRVRKITQWEKPEGYIVDLSIVEEEHEQDEGSKHVHFDQTVEVDDLDGDTDAEKSLSSKSPGTAGSKSPGSVSVASSASRSISSIASNPNNNLIKVRPKSRKKSIRLWSKRETASFGQSSDSEVYYINNETGETQWNRPDDYVSDSEAEATEIKESMNFDPNDSLQTSFEIIGILSTASFVECKSMLINKDSSAFKTSREKLEQLLLLIQHVGSEEEWDSFITNSDYELVKTVLYYLGYDMTDCFVPPSIRLLVTRILVLFSKLKPVVLLYIMDNTWKIDGAKIMRELDRGILESLQQSRKASSEGDKTDSDTSIYAYVLLITGLLREFHSHHARCLAPALLPSHETVGVLFDVMADTTEEIFLACGICLLNINMHYALPSDEGDAEGDAAEGDAAPNALMQIMINHPKTEFFGEAVLHLLNSQHYPYDDAPLLSQTLHFLLTLFHHAATASYLYTNDLKVLVDIIILELADLPLDDGFRLRYLNVLHLLLLNSPWLEQGRYRRDDLLGAMEQLLEAEDEAMDNAACQKVRDIFVDCAAILE